MRSVKSFGELPAVTVNENADGSNTFEINILRDTEKVAVIPEWHDVVKEPPEKGRTCVFAMPQGYRIGTLCTYAQETDKSEWAHLAIFDTEGLGGAEGQPGIRWIYIPDLGKKTTEVDVFEYDHNRWTDSTTDPDDVRIDPERYLFTGHGQEG